ncbi:MAG: ABC transporter permease, partial [Clostridia bacterium]|nr:ABC transporter permease [Clostridia bacterium]
MLYKKLIRTAWSYKPQFISMIIMITLGIGMFLGFNMEWHTIEYDTSRFFKDTKYADYRIYSQDGFTKEDLAAISDIKGVDAATRFLSVNLDIKGEKNKSLALDVSENYTVSTFTIMSGDEYDKESDGLWLSDKFAAANRIKLGDYMTLEFQGTEIKGKVIGLIKAGEHMICVADKNQLMPDYKTFGYTYISPKKLKSVIAERLEKTYTEELKKQGVPQENIKDYISEKLTDDEIALSTDKVFAQINLISKNDKSELEDAIKQKLGRTIMVTSKDDHIVYKEAMEEAEEGKTMGSILPVLFLAIAILTMVTTMHRIATKEKLQIGTLKALGFKNRRILLHYTYYGLFMGVLGTGFGVALGYAVCKLIMSENGMMGTYFDMPDWPSAIPLFCYPVMIGTVLALTVISLLSVRRQLKGTAAEALRPYTPKKMRKTVFEHFKFWGKLNFGTKWNIRDLSRHKSRSAMTLVGIIGCMILMVGGLGMRDTMAGFLDLLNNDISNYSTKVNLSDDVDYDKAIKLADELDGDWESLSGISLDGDTVTLNILNN